MKKDQVYNSDRAALIPRLPKYFHPQGGEEIPRDLLGASILGFGTTEERVEGGGLVIDYQPTGNKGARRLILGFTELGMWVERLSTLDGDRE
jgi:hypothetical protein